jgi:hypothetical protein
MTADSESDLQLQTREVLVRKCELLYAMTGNIDDRITITRFRLEFLLSFNVGDDFIFSPMNPRI